MADRNNNKNAKQQQKDGTSTISYLPILFANGYPIALEKMSEEQLELFVPFLVRCSLNLKSNEEPKTAPKWWPPGIEFSVPFEKPKDFKDNWKSAMKNLVTDCYDHHKQPFLLRYSKELSKNDTANLRYVRDSDTTTALWSRNPEKLLLTFRNDLMLYDRKKRRQLWKKDETVSETEEQESAFDIFLCDFCDATFVSEEAYQEHEKKCNRPDDEADGAAADSRQAIENIVISDDDEGSAEEEDEEEEDGSNQLMAADQTDFMAYFYLVGTGVEELPHRNNSFLERSLSPKKRKKQAPRTRKTITQKDREREFTIPFSSPAGLALATGRKPIDDDYVMDKLDAIEDYCQARPNTRVTRAKVRFPQNNTEKTLMRQMRKIRPFYWPRRQLHTRARERNFEFLNRWLIEDCKPFNVVLQKLTSEDVKSYKERLIRIKEAKERANCVDLISDSDSESVEVDDDVNEAMLKLNGQFLVTPAASSSSLPTVLPKYSEFLSIPASQQRLPNGDIKFTRQTTTTTTIIKQNALSFQRNVNNYHRVDNEIIEHRHVQRSSSAKSIHEWLNNVNGESFQLATQLSLINS